MFYIPIPDGPDTSQTLTFDNKQYNFRIRWNTLSKMWNIYIGEIGKQVSCKIPVTIGFDLLSVYSGIEGIPKGKLFAVDTINGYGRVDRDNLVGTNSRYRLLYIGVDEI